MITRRKAWNDANSFVYDVADTLMQHSKLFDESLVVNPDNKGIQNIVVQLYLRRGKSVKAHPDYAKGAKAEITFDKSDDLWKAQIENQDDMMGRGDSEGRSYTSGDL